MLILSDCFRHKFISCCIWNLHSLFPLKTTVIPVELVHMQAICCSLTPCTRINFGLYTRSYLWQINFLSAKHWRLHTYAHMNGNAPGQVQRFELVICTSPHFAVLHRLRLLTDRSCHKALQWSFDFSCLVLSVWNNIKDAFVQPPNRNACNCFLILLCMVFNFFSINMMNIRSGVTGYILFFLCSWPCAPVCHHFGLKWK